LIKGFGMYKRYFISILFPAIFFTVLTVLAIFLALNMDWGVYSEKGYDIEGNAYNQFSNQTVEEIFEGISGRIPILEYHTILTPNLEKTVFKNRNIRKKKWFNRLVVTSEQFRNHLQTLYKFGFRNISLNEYLSLIKGQKKAFDRIPPGSKLYVLTFDDATFGQFDFTGFDKDGNPIIDPDCAVGIMIEFAREHPDFKLNAAFNIDFENTPFMQVQYVKKKLNMLLDYGFEIVNHTKNHKPLSRYIKKNPEKIAYEIGRAMELFESYLGYRAIYVNKICYPDGKANSEVWDYVKEVSYNGRIYRFAAALDAEGLQARNPNDKYFNIYNIARIEANDKSLKNFVFNAPGIYRTPSIREKVVEESLVFYQPVKDIKRATYKVRESN